MAISFENFNMDFYLYMNDNLDFEKIKNNKKLAYDDYINNIEIRIAELDKSFFDNFDPIIYLLCNKDLRKLNIKNINYAHYHYLKFGKKENRLSSIAELKKILKNFNWIEYIYLNKYLIHKLNNERECLIHYLLNGILFNKKYKSDKIICTEFNWIIYTNYYHDLNYIKNSKEAFEHYINYGIDNDRIDWINLKNILYNININNYLKINNDINLKSEKSLIEHWIKNDKNGCVLTINKLENNFNYKFCIGITVYSDINTPKERLYASFKSLNYIFLLIQNCDIYLIIDGNINEQHFQFINKLKKAYDNCFIYRNKNNYGIAVSKNICLNILMKNPKCEYFCLLDDDIFIKKNFIDFSINILENYDIPILTNFNKGLPHFENYMENKDFIKSQFFLGNILIFTKKYFEKYGYFRIFPYKWGEEHQEFTKRYFKNNKYKDTTIDFRKYLNDEFFINKVSTLHLHSILVDHELVKENKKKYLEYIKLDGFVDFNIEEYEYIEIV